MRPTFIFFGGIGWCGTTSLHKSLGRSKYMHSGLVKESHYIERLKEYEEWGFIAKNNFIKKIPSLYDQNIGSVVEFLEEIRDVKSGKIDRESSVDRTLTLADVDDDVIDNFLNPIPSEKNYRDYYIQLSKAAIENNYQAVGDFSNTHGVIYEYSTKKAKKILDPYFNIKSIIMVRDPVRRCFSNLNSSYHSRAFKTSPDEFRREHKRFNNATDIFKHYLNVQKDTIHFDYGKIIKSHYDAFGKDNVHIIIMEEYFTGPNSVGVKKLEEFIDFKLSKYVPCAFVPDKGINAPKLEGLEDQWMSDHEVLTPELYMEARSKLDYIYKGFEELYGHIPDSWGEPIDYGY